jgi:DNA repair exonuclease SbcCD ATPase subunit
MLKPLLASAGPGNGDDMFCKAFKMMVLTGAVLGGTGFLLFGTDLGSYLGTMAASVKEGVEEQIPVDFEIKRAVKLIEQIDPQIEHCKRDVARAEVELEELQSSVLELEKSTALDEKRLKSGARLLSGDGSAQYTLASDVLTRRRVECDLQRTMDSFRNNEAILKTKRALIERQSQAVSVAKQRLSAVRAEKEHLADQVRSLRTQQQWIETMGASHKRFDLDDSALSQAKEALAKVQRRLDVAQKMLENDMVFQAEDPVAVTEPGRNVLEEIRQHFGGGQQTIAVDAPTASAH